MNNRQKNALYSLVLILAVLAVYMYRKNREVPPQTAGAETSLVTGKLVHLQGVTMGVIPYNIKYVMDTPVDYQREIDTLLAAFNQSLSHYVPNSELSRFNRTERSLDFESRFFLPVLEASRVVYEQTQGAFDPTVSPLINAWGFGSDKSFQIENESSIDSLLQLVGFNKIVFDTKQVRKTKPAIALNFSAIAKGYAVDLVADFLTEKGVQDYMVEIGREVVCKGQNAAGNTWRIGIVNPNYHAQGEQLLNATVALENRALATSGSYENYYEKDGKKYSHTIDPRTGYPVTHNLLSASIFAPNCMLADAYATAVMVIGVEAAKALVEANQELDAILIYDENGTVKLFVSESLKPYVAEVQ